MVDQGRHTFRAIEWTTQKSEPDYKLWVLVCDVSLLVHQFCNKQYHTNVNSVNNRGNCVFQGLVGREKGEEVLESFILSVQYLSKPKAAF